MTLSRIVSGKILFLVLVIQFAGLLGWVQAQEDAVAPRPKTEDLLPETTVVFVEVRDVQELVKKIQESNGGRLLAEESIAPLVNDLYGQALDAFNEVTAENEVDLTAQEILSLPHGEINIAVIAPKRKNPVFLFTFEFDTENEAVDKVLDLAQTQAEDEGNEVESEEVEEVEFIRLGEVTYFRKDGVLVASNSRDELEAYLARWQGREVEKIRPLAKNRKFVKIMNRCQGTKSVPNDLRFYVDPIELARSSFRGNAGAQMAINFLPVFGLDGLLAVGGATSLLEDDFESVYHAHLLLSSPKKGLFEMIAMKPSDYRPAAWVPEDATFYVSTSWDVKKMFSEIGKIVDQFQGEGTWEQQIITRVNEEMGEDFYQDVLDSVSGRFTFLQWAAEGDASINAEIPCFAIQMKDENKWESILERIQDKLSQIAEDEEMENEVLTEKEYKGVTYWVVDEERNGRRTERARQRLNRRLGNEDEDGPEINFEIRADQPCFAMIDNELVICSSPKFIEKAIETSRGDLPSLVQNESFQSVFKEISRLAGSDIPAVIFYQQPQRTLEKFYNLAKGDTVKNLLESNSEQKYVGGIKRAMEDNPLPPFEDIKRYFQPNGAFVVSDESGYHLLGFQMRAPEKDESTEEDK